MVEAIKTFVEHAEDDVLWHCFRVAEYMQVIYAHAQELQVYPRDPWITRCDPKTIVDAGILHDVGKSVIPTGVLYKHDSLDNHEWSIMRRHVDLGTEELEYFMSLDGSCPEHAVYSVSYILTNQHHERWDGKGYSRCLRGTEINIIARICAIADSFDAMTSDRPYRRAMGFDEAVAEIAHNAATQFDPVLVGVFMNCLNGVYRVYRKYLDGIYGVNEWGRALYQITDFEELDLKYLARCSEY